LTSSGSCSLAVVAGPTSAGTTATGAASQLAVEQVVALQPATARNKARNPKILRMNPLLWTLPRLDGSVVPMAHLTPILAQQCGREVTRRKNKAGQEFAGQHGESWRRGGTSVLECYTE